jgi:acetoin utilization protein AcuB
MEATMLVHEIMTQQPIAISPETTLPEAMRLMKQHGFRRLPVLKNKKLVGIVTDRDLKEAMPSDATSLSIWELNFLLSKLEVSEIMRSPVFTVTEHMSVEDAARLMLDKKIGGLPVMNKDALAGMIPTSDVLRAFIDGKG